VEIGNDQAMHGTEPPEPLELIVDARMQFDMLAAVGVLTKAQASSILRLLESGGETLSPADRAFRKNIIRYLKKEADFVTVFAEMLQIDPAVEHPGTKSKGDKRTDSPVSPKPKRDPSIEPATPRQRAAKTFLLSLPPVNTSILPSSSRPELSCLRLMPPPRRAVGASSRRRERSALGWMPTP
jgi:hypothetical protein